MKLPPMYHPVVTYSLHSHAVRAFASNYHAFVASGSPRRLLGSAASLGFLNGYRAFAAQRKKDLEVLLAASDARLCPFSDSLHENLSFAILEADDREEKYTAVLEWLVRRLPAERVLRLFGVQDNRCLEGEWLTEREHPVRHNGQAGRLDLVLRNGKSAVVVEVKTRSYAEPDLQKHQLYCSALQRTDLSDAHKVFLALTDEGIELHRFQFCSWRSLCLRLRQNSIAVIQERPYTEAALFLSLVGMLEQNLLQLNPQFAANLPAVVDYLSESALMEKIDGA
jgi:hypothetical protein